MTASTTMATDWYETRGYGGGITRIRERFIHGDVRCNMWHVRGRDRDALIDTGFGLRSMRDEIAALRERPVLAVASHTHFDHVGGHHQFDERLAHPAEADTLAAPDPDNTVWRGWETGSVVLAEPEPGFDQLQWCVRPAPATRLVDEGDVIDLGDRVLEVLHLPGHSPGSIGLYEAATRTLFTGDVIYDGELYDWLYHSDRELYRETLARVRELPADTFHCGHEESFGRDRLIELVDAYLDGPSAAKR
jgi:glyoxylase-like metal-dependent hydrolase (beta-lactamase superfamily II)